jgi:hypothetical protein
MYLLLLLACSDKRDALEALCASECAQDLGFGLNLVVLTARADAPQPPDVRVTTCDTSDTTWPCVHVNSLAGRFVGEDGAICLDPAEPDTCVHFTLAAHSFRADLAGLSDPGCTLALSLADDAGGQADQAAWADALAEAAASCTDTRLYDPRRINIYIVDNPFGNDSFNRDVGPHLPVNLIDLDRLPDDPADPLAFVHAASEHELGHGFGLGHTCADPIPDGATPTNIMQTTVDNCCCEAATANGWEDEPWFLDEQCNDCSADARAPATCDDLPGALDDPECSASGWFPLGTRGLPFSDAVNADFVEGSLGQVTRILNRAVAMCESVCLADG